MEGRSSPPAAASSSTCATSSSATTPTRCATSSRVAGPETQDTDFTWAEFVRRNNDELVAGWGNLVNRTVVDGREELRRDPGAGRADRRRPGAAGRRRPGGFATVGGLIERSPAEGGDQRGDAGRRRGQQVPLRPGAVEAQDDDPDRMRTVLHVALQAVERLQHAAHAVPAALGAAVHELLGGDGRLGPACREIDEVDDLDGGPPLPGAHRRLHGRRAWESRPAQARHAVGAAHAGVRASSTRRSSTRSWPGWRRAALMTGGPLRTRAAGDATGADRAPEPLPPSPVVDSHCHLDIADGVDGDWLATADAVGTPPQSGVTRIVQIGCDLPGARVGGRRRGGARGSRGRRSRCTPTRRRGWPSGDLDDGLAEIDAWRRAPGCGRSGRPGSTTSAPGPDGRGRAGGVVPRAHRDRQASTARRWSSTTATRTTTCCACSMRRAPPDRVVFHCFSGDAAFARACVDRGYCPVLRRHGDVQERRQPARGARGHPAGPAAGRDRRAVPDAGAATAAARTRRT